MAREARTAVVLVVMILCNTTLAIGADGLIAHWKFDEGAGGTAYDSAGSNDGTIYGAAWTTGTVDGALRFDGINDSVDVGDPPDGSLDLGISDFTLSVWFKTSMTVPGWFVGKRAKGYYAGYDFYIERDGKVFARIADGQSVLDARTAAGFNDGLWHHAAAVYDRDDVIRTYIDGVSKATSINISSIDSVNNSEPFTIGDRDDPGHHYPFKGSLDDVRIYKRALSAAEVQALYQGGLVNTAPIACIVGGDRVVEAGEDCEARVVLDGSCSSDEDSTEGTNDDINDFDWYNVIDVCEPNSDIYLGSGEVIECNLGLGEHIIILEVADKAGAFDSNEVVITVEDVTPPELSLVVEPNVLWPPNGKMVQVRPEWEVSDNCDEEVDVSLVDITMSAAGDINDYVVIEDDGSIYLRARKGRGGSGRIYTLTYEAVDDSGNVAEASATVTVPHSRGPRKLGSGLVRRPRRQVYRGKLQRR
jgi:hypothetical protein